MTAEKDHGVSEHDETLCCGHRRPVDGGFVILNGYSLKETNELEFFVINGPKLVEVVDGAADTSKGKSERGKIPIPASGDSKTTSHPDRPDVHPTCLESGTSILSLFDSGDEDDQIVVGSKDNLRSSIKDNADAFFFCGRRNGLRGCTDREMKRREIVKKENRILLKKEAPTDPFQMELAMVGNNARQKRASSIRAEERIKKQILVENIANEAPNKENEIESFFCGLPRRKRSNAENILSKKNDFCRPEGSQAEDEMKTRTKDGMEDVSGSQSKDFRGSPAHKTLKDKTNSPAKAGLKPRNKHASSHGAEEGDFLNKFFLDDLGFLKDKKKIRKEKKKLSNRYLKLKKRNTCFNQGYTTVSPKKKAVIDLFSCPKTFYKSVKKERAVHFDVENVVSVHNSTNNLQPILLEQNDKPSFKWEKDKEKVDIVKRVDLGYETSVDDFIFRRVDKKIES